MMDARFPYLTQDSAGGKENPQYVANLDPGAAAGFKDFDCRHTALTAVTTQGWSYFGEIEVLTEPDGEPLGSIPVKKSNEWKTWSGEVPIPDGVHSIYLRYKGFGCVSIRDFTLNAS